MLLTALFLSFALEPAVNWLASKGMRRGFGDGPRVHRWARRFHRAPVASDRARDRRRVHSSSWTTRPGSSISSAAWLRPLGMRSPGDPLCGAPEERRPGDRGRHRAAGRHLQRDARDHRAGSSAVARSPCSPSTWSPRARSAADDLRGMSRPRTRSTCCSSGTRRSTRPAATSTRGCCWPLINGTGMFACCCLVRRAVRGAARVFEGSVAAFIPIIGTYIGGAVPILFALLTGTTAGSRRSATCRSTSSSRTSS